MKVLFLLLAVFSQNSSASDFTWLAAVKKNCRQDVMGTSARFPRTPIYSPILDADRAEDLVEDPARMIRSLSQMESANLTAKHLSVEPWSDTYWPLYLGAIAQRYEDRSFTGLDWKEAKQYIAKNPVKRVIAKKEMDILAPSEKYDFLMEIKQNTLTSANWAEGENYYREYGEVETWMGLCHGWAAASMMMPRPVKKVVVNTRAGDLTFFPSDIKALGTLLWAKANKSSRFIGGRCNSKNPSTDPMDRPQEQDCLDNNPGTWHMAIVNQIGQFDRSFVMDATYDYQVWNQPIYGYHYSYYNPKTGEDVKTLNEAIVKRSDWSTDPRRGVRASDAEFLVGIKMVVQYVIEASPDHEEDQPSNFSEVTYIYDLELNRRSEIVGGEWYSSNHPDFLWVPNKKTFPQTYGDSSSLVVDLNHPSDEVKKAAQYNATHELPFGAVVRAFFKASAKE